MKPGKLEQYNIMFKSLKQHIDAIVFTETWNVEDKLKLCHIDGYVPVHLLRTKDDGVDIKENGGGVTIFVKNNLQFRRRDDLTFMLPYMECLFIETCINDKKYLIGGFYRVPNTNVNIFIEKFNEIIEQLKTYYELI